MPRLRAWLAVAALVLIAGAFEAWRMFLLERRQYALRLQKAIWTASPAVVYPQTGPEKASKPVVLFLGDSRMASWGLPEFKNWNLVNAGVPGSTSGQCLLAAAPMLERYHPRTVVLETGINDLKYLGLKPEMKVELVRLVTGNISNIVRLCSSEGSRVIVLEIWPPSTPDFRRRLVWNRAVNESVVDCNEALRRLNSDEAQVRVLDLFLASDVTPSTERYRDTLHLKPETYRLLESSLEKVLDGIQPAKNRPRTME